MDTSRYIAPPHENSAELVAAPLQGPERLDGWGLLAIGLVGTVLAAREIDWIAFFLLFWIIDVVGYWPGVLAAKLKGRGNVSPVFVHLYNLNHSAAGALVIALTYCFFAPESAPSAFAIAIHLGIDRGILANRLKRTGEVF